MADLSVIITTVVAIALIGFSVVVQLIKKRKIYKQISNTYLIQYSSRFFPSETVEKYRIYYCKITVFFCFFVI